MAEGLAREPAGRGAVFEASQGAFEVLTCPRAQGGTEACPVPCGPAVCEASQGAFEVLTCPGAQGGIEACPVPCGPAVCEASQGAYEVLTSPGAQGGTETCSVPCGGVVCEASQGAFEVLTCPGAQGGAGAGPVPAAPPPEDPSCAPPRSIPATPSHKANPSNATSSRIALQRGLNPDRLPEWNNSPIIS